MNNNNPGALARARKGGEHVGIAIFIVVLVGVIALLLYLGGNDSGGAKADALAQCLKAKNVTMYGAYWCPHCQSQKKAFGSSFQYVPYVECTQEADRCSAANVTGYPTWIFPDGSRLEGEVALDKLAEKSGCPAPSVSSTTPGTSSSTTTFSPAPAVSSTQN